MFEMFRFWSWICQSDDRFFKRCPIFSLPKWGDFLCFPPHQTLLRSQYRNPWKFNLFNWVIKRTLPESHCSRAFLVSAVSIVAFFLSLNITVIISGELLCTFFCKKLADKKLSDLIWENEKAALAEAGAPGLKGNISVCAKQNRNQHQIFFAQMLLGRWSIVRKFGFIPFFNACPLPTSCIFLGVFTIFIGTKCNPKYNLKTIVRQMSRSKKWESLRPLPLGVEQSGNDSKWSSKKHIWRKKLGRRASPPPMAKVCIFGIISKG